MAGEFIVEAIPVSISQGNDGALYLLVEKREIGVQDKIRAAVLIDSENGVLEGVKMHDSKSTIDRRPILSTFEWIEKSYNLSPYKRLKLTSIVVTGSNEHGIANFLHDAVVQAHGLSTRTPIPWLKWDEAGRPLTYFYSLVGSNTNSTGSDDESRFDYSSGTVSIKSALSRDSKQQSRYSFARHHGTSGNGLLGANFLNNAILEIPAEDTTDVTPAVLLVKNPPEKGWPAMYCVAADGFNFSITSYSNKPTTVASHSRNKTHAITAVMMWDTSPPRASHYFGGNLVENEKTELQGWLSRDNVHTIKSVYMYNGTMRSADGLRLARAVRYPSPLARTWILKGSMHYFYGATMAKFFPSSLQDAVIPLLEKILVEKLEVTYEYNQLGQGQAKASSFVIAGNLLVGKHRLTLDFTHDGAVWNFDATMNANENEDVESNAGEMIRGIAGDLGLPDFLVNIVIPKNGQNEIGLSIKQESDLLVLVATWKIGNLTFQYLQFREIAKNAPLRRVVLASLDNLSATPIPMLGDIPQPFEQIVFAWVQSLQPNAKGLVKGEIENINSLLSRMKKPQIPYKILDKNEDQTSTTTALLNGLHFMVVANTTQAQSQVILDYAFSQAKSGQSKSPQDSADNPGSRMVSLQKVMGVFSIKNIGLRYSTGLNEKQSILSIRLDASVMVGPIEFSVLGLSINLDFADGSESDGERYSLHNLPTPYPTLEGLQTSFDKPPIQISGALQLLKTTELESYAGALVISFIPWLFQAAGYYGKIKTPKEFETVFVYCILKGPLITLQFASIEGICGGFGFNSQLKFPTAKNVMEFPLIAQGAANPPGGGTSPVDALESLLKTSWFVHQEKSFWVAAGLTVKAFEILSVQAVVVVQWNPYVELGIFAVATASIPGGRSPRQFAFVQLGIIASVNFETGILKIEGELTPSSYILDPSCHLTGGFALYSWFDSRDPNLRGDWVFSIGGFHPAYQKPPQYPEPSRLGISWQFGKSISISGQAYFAITPKVCMGGGRLDVQLSLKPLYAYFNAFVDFLINYKPFYFIAEGGVSVGVKFTLDLWLVTIKISVQIGARLYIRGPPIQGTVHVDFWVFGFDVDFGAKSIPGPAPLKLQDFIDLVSQADTPGAAAFIKGPVTEEEKPKLHVFSIEEGLVPKYEIESTPSGDHWVVSPGGFIFSIACKFVVQEAVVITKTYGGEPYEGKTVGKNHTVNAKPMHANGVTSSLKVTIQPTELFVRDTDFPDPTWDDYDAIYTDVPEALWGQYDARTDPSKTRNPSALLNGTSGKTLNHMTGIRIANPQPICAEDKTIAYEIALFQIGSLGPFELPLTEVRDQDFEGDNAEDTEQWARVKAKWETPGIEANAAQRTVDLWTDVLASKMGWDADRIKAGEEEAALTGAKPERIIKNITKYYLWAPALSKA
ncbi:hypothetical protein BGW36DRAFT_459012 [Talaromyces proteolyticus]|uniref:DUF6603 domain-containing protein n=1 Tax=Talaromyces proteolyticus TaxID=1131652 RepID=A0AAD4Q419_9EURO|nr:uncharacterized protein BGW36DRAFT_459012 [Talaromyces proteolyticus]KAH8702291.1 hypothetical protein BGW36DRAFT_459012 [Talaromyces proteolyticus]